MLWTAQRERRLVASRCGLARALCSRGHLVFLLGTATILTSPTWADPPSGYYNGTSGLSGAALRSAVHQIIDDHQRFPYSSSSTDTWDILSDADEDPANPSDVLTVYRNSSPNSNDHSSGSGWNREHTWPSSYGFTNDGGCNYPYTDCHQLRAADWGYNSARGNLVFDWCVSSCTSYPAIGSGAGVNLADGSGNSGSWQVRADQRGDIARAMFYMDVRYEGGSHSGGCAEPNLILTDNRSLINSNTGSNQSVAYMGLLSVLIEWHNEDPVDAREELRNDVVFSYQGNRNPFVDHPEWVCALWGGCTDPVPPAAPVGLGLALGSCEVDLDWSDNSEPDLLGYTVYRSLSAGGPYSEVSPVAIPSSNYTDSSVASGTQYFYLVTATDLSGNESAQSATQSIVVTGSCAPAPVTEPWINEIHYDNSGGDTGEGVEIAGPAGMSLTGWDLVGYNGNGGSDYNTINLSGVFSDQLNGVGTLWFPFLGLQNGAPDGIALVDDSGGVVQFLSYEGTLVATGGPALGMTSVDIGVTEGSGTAVGESLQLTGSGTAYDDFTWQPPALDTPGAPNVGQTFPPASNTRAWPLTAGGFFDAGSSMTASLEGALATSPPTEISPMVWRHEIVSIQLSGGGTVLEASPSGGGWIDISAVSGAVVDVQVRVGPGESHFGQNPAGWAVVGPAEAPTSVTLTQLEPVQIDPSSSYQSGDRLSLLLGEHQAFVRGDANADLSFDISDPVTVLDVLFSSGSAPCLRALDANDDSSLDLADVTWLIDGLFGFGPPVSLSCDHDLVLDTLGCAQFSTCP